MDTHPTLHYEPAVAGDLEALVALRIAAMRDSLERIGRYDPVRAREWFSNTYSPAHTEHIVMDGQRVGVVVIKPEDGALRLENLYIAPAAQGRGVGAAVLARVFEQADAAGLAVRVTALRGSDANRFYVRHGFHLLGGDDIDVHYLRPARGAGDISPAGPAP